MSSLSSPQSVNADVIIPQGGENVKGIGMLTNYIGRCLVKNEVSEERGVKSEES